MFKSSNRTFLIAWSLAIIVTILLALHRHYDVNDPFEESIFEAWGTIMGAIFTAATVYLLYKQNQQQLEDRSAASAPDLYPSEVNVDIKDEVVSPFYEYNVERKQFLRPYFNTATIGESSWDNSPSFKVFNIGIGAAKQIEIKWRYFSKDLKPCVREYYQVHDLEYDANLNDVKRIDFISSTAYTNIRFSNNYSYLLGLSSPVFTKNCDIEVPNILLTIEYSDIHNNRLSKIFRLQFLRNFDVLNIQFIQEYQLHTKVDEGLVHLLLHLKEATDRNNVNPS